MNIRLFTYFVWETDGFYRAAYLHFHTYHTRLPAMYSEVFSAHEDMFNVNSVE